MKLGHFLFSCPIDFETGNIQQLIIENPSDLGVLVLELSEQLSGKNGRFVLSESNKELSMDKDILFIESPFNIEKIQKMIINGIVTSALIIANDADHQSETYDQLSRIEQYVNSIMNEIDLELFISGINPTLVFKNIDIDLNLGDKPNQILFNTVRMISLFTKKKLTIILNPSSYLSKEDLDSLSTGIAYLNYPVLFIDHIPQKEYPYKLLDCDFCEINVNNDDPYLFEV